MGGVVKPEEFDYFHEVGYVHERLSDLLTHNHSIQLIVHSELSRIGSRGFIDGLLAGPVIGAPPILLQNWLPKSFLMYVGLYAAASSTTLFAFG
jgi:hypothetical protein